MHLVLLERRSQDMVGKWMKTFIVKEVIVFAMSNCKEFLQGRTYRHIEGRIRALVCKKASNGGWIYDRPLDRVDH
jgi:hypothetical protein